MGIGEDLGQGPDKDDLASAALLSRANLDTVDQGPDDFDSLQSRRLVLQKVLQLGNLPAVKLRKSRMRRDFEIALSGLQFRRERVFARLQPFLVISTPRHLALRRAVLAERRTGAALGYV